MVTPNESAEESPLEAELDELHTVLQPLRLPSGARLFEEGEPGDRVVLIADGKVRSSVRLPNGTEQTLTHAGPGDVVGEIALLTGARRSATVTALTPLRGWTLDRHGFDLLRWDPRRAAIAVVQRLIALATARLRTSRRSQTRSVRRDIYGYRAPIAHHLQGEPPSSGSGPSASPRIPAQPDVSAPPPIGGADVTASPG